MSRVAFLAYGLLAYALFLIAILYGIAFLDRYLKGKSAPELDSKETELHRYQLDP